MSGLDLTAGVADGVAAVAEQSLAPVSAPPNWKPVRIFDAWIAFSGGLSTNGPTVAKRIDYQLDGKTWTFVELAKNAPWFLKGVGGPKSRKGDLKTVTVMNDIRELTSDWLTALRYKCQGADRIRGLHPQSQWPRGQLP